LQHYTYKNFEKNMVLTNSIVAYYTKK